MRASSDGTATPVTVVEMIRSTSLGAQPRLVERAGDRRAPEFDGVLDEQVVGLAEVGQRPAYLAQRQDEVATVDLGAARAGRGRSPRSSR